MENKFKILNTETDEDVTKLIKEEYENVLRSRVDVEFYKAWGNHSSLIPTDKEEKLTRLKNLLDELFYPLPLWKAPRF